MLSLAVLLSNAEAAIVINEILADPGTVAGDANCDGTASTTSDEFVELVNTGASTVDLSGGTLNDLTGVRHTFPAGSTLAAGQAMVIFGGGTPTFNAANAAIGAWCRNLPTVSFQVSSTNTLGLNNTGDTISIVSATGLTVAEYVYGAEAGNDNSITLSPDLDTANPMVEHVTVNANLTWSPGTQLDGSQFGSTPAVTTLSQPAPGTAGQANVWTLTNGDPNTVYLLVGSLARGAAAHPACPNTPSGLSNPQVYGQATTNGSGTASFSVNVPAQAAGRTVYMQAGSLAVCDVSNVAATTF